MKEDEQRQVVDLSRYRQAATQRAAKADAARPKPQTERLIGSRKGAPVILAIIILAAAFLWLAPKLTFLG